MSTTSACFGIKGPVHGDRSLFERLRAYVTDADGWASAEFKQPPRPDELEAIVEGLCREASVPGWLSYVETSDYGYIACVDHAGVIRARLLFGARLAAELASWRQIVARSGSSNAGADAQSIDRFLEWSEAASGRLDRATLVALLDREWLFPEEGVDAVLDGLGFGRVPI